MLVEFFVDACCLDNGKPTSRMGVGIVGMCEERRKTFSIPLGGPGSNQKAEVLAVAYALLQLPSRADYDVVVTTDSEYALNCLTGTWKPLKNREEIAQAKQLIAECRSFSMLWVRGHSGHPENEIADHLAGEAARRDP